MRAITGWRFLIYIALPLVLASLGAINLSYDLMRRVEAGSNAAEHQRNVSLLTRTFGQMETDLGRMVRDNAQWDEAVRRMAGPQPDAVWFQNTWGSALSLGYSYDQAAVLDAATGKVILHTGQAPLALGNGMAWNSVLQRLDPASSYKGLATGFVVQETGAQVVAVSPIMAPGTATGTGKVLMLARNLDVARLDALRKQLSLDGLKIADNPSSRERQIALRGPDGSKSVTLVWQNRRLGEIVTEAAWSKAGLILGFLVLVMAGIGYVCWKLVQQLVEDEGKAQHNALHDTLTGLPNRLALIQSMQALRKAGQPHAIAFADLDGFKDVNDSYGHEFGDRLLFMVAKGVQKLSRDAALSCRLGGDEFVVLYAGADALAKARDFSVHLVSMLQQPFDMEGRIASVGASIGLAESEGTSDETEVLRRSDIAMYRAKAGGKNRHCVFDKSFDLERQENLAIAEELKGFLEARDLGIVFQPVVDARSTLITGVEALARWPESSGRKVSPDRFIQIAETTGLIDQLGELILERACVAAANWPQIRLAVNISAVQINNPKFVQRSLAVLERHGIATNRVEFEITETSLINDTEHARLVFKSLQQAGIKIALDDFGTGFSSIGYLRSFQFDRIKIDKSIVSKLLTSTAELSVVQGTLLVARGLSAEVTAEGVESAEEASVLRLAGCTELQGFYYHRPMPASAVTETLRRQGVALVPRSVVAG